MTTGTRQILIAAGLLAVFAALAAALLAFVHDTTRERIALEKRKAMLRSLYEIVPDERHDNDIVTDTITIPRAELLGQDEPFTVYRARMGKNPVAVVMPVIAPDGYSGAIYMMVGVNTDGTVAGVRVVRHKETPGLGDPIDIEKSDWVTGFNGRSLVDPDSDHWKVKKDGGVFDQFSAATITPRAVVRGAQKALIYFERHRERLFKVETDTPHGDDSVSS